MASAICLFKLHFSLFYQVARNPSKLAQNNVVLCKALRSEGVPLEFVTVRPYTLRKPSYETVPAVYFLKCEPFYCVSNEALAMSQYQSLALIACSHTELVVAKS